MSNFDEFFDGGGCGLGIRRMDPLSFSGWAGDYGNPLIFPVADGSANRVFSMPNTVTTSITLVQWPAGTTVATIQPSNVVTGTSQQWLDAFWHDAANGYLYVGAKNSANLIRFAKISDVDGTVTTLGAGFTPTTIGNWPQTGGFLQSVGGALRFYSPNKVVHIIDQSAGTLTSQDQALTLGGYAARCGGYVSADGTMACIPKIVPVSGGHIQIAGFQKNATFVGLVRLSFSDVFGFPCLVTDNDPIIGTIKLQDDDTVIISADPSTASHTLIPHRFFLRSEWDRILSDYFRIVHGI